jgi:hypothetical protein
MAPAFDSSDSCRREVEVSHDDASNCTVFFSRPVEDDGVVATLKERVRQLLSQQRNTITTGDRFAVVDDQILSIEIIRDKGVRIFVTLRNGDG